MGKPINVPGSNVATSHLRLLTIPHGIIKFDNFSLLSISATRIIPFCNLDVLLTVHLSIILVINQRNAQIFVL